MMLARMLTATTQFTLFKLIIIWYLLHELLTPLTTLVVHASTQESKEFINGKVIRVLVFHVRLDDNRATFISFY